MYDYSKLIGRIAEKRLTKEQVADALGISYASMLNKLNGKSQFKGSEIVDLANFLGIDQRDIVAYFFAS